MSKELTELAVRQLSRRTLFKGATALTVGGITLHVPQYVRAQDTIKLAFSVPGLNFPFFVHMMKLAKEHAESIGGIEFLELDGQEAGQPSSTNQTADVEAAIADGINALVISPNDVQALAPAIQGALDAGVVVATVDRNVSDVATLAHVGADNVEGGRIQGRYLLELLPDGGEVFELQGQSGASAAIDRHTGFDEIIAGQDKVKVIVSQDAQFTRVQAVTVMEASLAANPNPAAVVCANDEMAFGASEVAQANGLAIPIIGFDALPEALQAIQAGTLNATIEQFPGQQAAGAIDIVVAKIRDGADPAQHDNFLVPALINADNLSTAERAEEAGLAPAATPAG